MTTRDYHDFCHPGTPKHTRDKLYIGDIYLNGAECKNCGYFIRSKNKHDRVPCKCGEISIDGGSHYHHVHGFPHLSRSVLIFFDDVKKGLDKLARGLKGEEK